ncbi:MAG: TIGR00269 family protein [Anaerolineae bacterium]|nr:TIGR00269 family protein [Anaerolineae bacterium]MDH7473663.1 TIGR00269 family protein [Anaerolineae bacterium]
MKCRKCGRPAVINMRQHKLALCEEHFLEWVLEQTRRAIDRYHMFAPDDKVLVAVSGGKDSLSLWDVLLRLGYRAEGLYIKLGVEEGAYSDKSLGYVERFAAERGGVHFQVVDVKVTYGMSVLEVARARHRGHKACSVCGLIKRHIMNRVAYEGGYSCIATGHNLDDEVAVLMQNTLRWQVGYLARQSPVLPATHPRLARKVKPFVHLYERETAAYALVRGIDYIYDECPYAVGATTLFYKDLLNQLEERSPGAKLSFYLSFLRAREQGLTFTEQTRLELHDCPRCGQPTTAPGLCAFCRLWEN